MSTNRIIVKGADFSQVAIEQEAFTTEVAVDFNWDILGKYISLNTGDEVALDTWNISNYITLPNNLISINGKIYGYPTAANIACYNDSNEYLGGFAASVGTNSYNYKSSLFPDGTTKIRLCSDMDTDKTLIVSLNFVLPG